MSENSPVKVRWKPKGVPEDRPGGTEWTEIFRDSTFQTAKEKAEGFAMALKPLSEYVHVEEISDEAVRSDLLPLKLTAERHTVDLQESVKQDIDFKAIDNALRRSDGPVAAGKVWVEDGQGWFRPYANIMKSKFVHLPYTYGTDLQDIITRVQDMFITWGYNVAVNTMTGDVFIRDNPVEWSE